MAQIQNVIDEETGYKLLRKPVATDRLYDIRLNPADVQSGDTINFFDPIVQTNLGKVEGSVDMNVRGETNDGGLNGQVRIGMGTVGEKYLLAWKAIMVSGDIITDTVVMEVIA